MEPKYMRSRDESNPSLDSFCRDGSASLEFQSYAKTNPEADS